MLPDGTLSSEPVVSDLVFPFRNSMLEDYELSPQSNINDTPRLLRVFYEDNWIKVNDSGSISEVLRIAGISHLGYAKDQNYRDVIVYVLNNETFLYWYDTAIGQMVTASFGKQIKQPCVSLDDVRFVMNATSDVIFAYIRGEKLCYRQQRERYQIEHVLGDALNLWQIGMGQNNRFSFITFD